MKNKTKATAKIQQQADGIARKRRLAAAREHPNPNRAVLEQCRILHEVILPEYLAEEPDCRNTRWFEHGYTDTFRATELYTRAYVECYPIIRQKFISHRLHPCPVDPDFVRNDAATMNALYRARQFADFMGVPYKPFIMGLCNALITEGGYHRVPLPNHLYPGKKDKALRHGLRVRESILHPDEIRLFRDDSSDHFLAVNYRNDPPQDRALGFMREVVLGNVLPAGMLRSYLRKGFISHDAADALFPEPYFREVIDEARAGDVDPVKPAKLPPFRPHCFGLHIADDPRCAACPWAVKCAGMVNLVERVQILVKGAANPRLEHRRELDRNRQREKRKRDREAEENSVRTDPDLRDAT